MLLNLSPSVMSATGLCARQLCRGLGLSYPSYRRWCQRQARGVPLLRAAGPRKLGPLPMDALIDDLQALVHRPRRTRATGALYARWRGYVGRRPLQGLVNARRHAWLRGRRQWLQRVRWRLPQLAWAIDATEYPHDAAGRRLVHVVVQDLATAFQFEPLLVLNLSGTEAAGYLGQLFRRHGAPLFLKRDNGGVFNTPEVNALLAQAGVLPLNSPVHCARYNGAIEHGIGEIKAQWRACAVPGRLWEPERARPYVRFFVHRHNQVWRRSLGGRSATAAYFHDRRARWTRARRHAIFAWISARAKRTLRAMEAPGHRDVRRAWRDAVESWLRRQGLIEVSINRNSVTPFSM